MPDEPSPPSPSPETPQGGPPGKPPPPKPWSADETRAFMTDLGAVIDRLGTRYLEFKREEWRNDVAMQNATAKADWWVLGILMLFLAVVIALVVILVWVGRVSGDALLFLVGTVAGYVFALVQRHLFPETVEVQQT